jgi:heterodisulfide reductase subunit C
MELGRMTPVTMEEVERTERIGVSAIEHFDQQQLLSLDACMECGRCEEACPAFATEAAFPKKVVQDLKALMTLNLAPRFTFHRKQRCWSDFTEPRAA